MFCAFTRHSYQVSVYMTIGPLVLFSTFHLALNIYKYCICYFCKQHNSTCINSDCTPDEKSINVVLYNLSALQPFCSNRLTIH